MPELPEVETVCRMLASKVVGNSIRDINVVRRDLRWVVQADFEDRCQGQAVISVFRRGKYIIIELGHGHIIWHLGMSGSITVQTNLVLKKHDHLAVLLSDGNYLVYNDPRRFGSVFWSDDWQHHPRIAVLGLEPLSVETTALNLYDGLRSKSKAIKEAVMDARLIVGVGNIYANEALFLSGIRPDVAAKSLSLSQVELLFANIRLVLDKAIAKGGTTLNDYVNLEGKPGYFQQELNVYGRSGKLCHKCSSKLEKLERFSRQTVYCPSCQS